MKFAVVLAFGLAAAPIAYAQQQGTNPGNTSKDSETADAQHNAPSGKAAVDEAKKQQNDTTANQGTTAPAGNKELSTSQVRKEKKKAMTRARAMKQQREEKGTQNWNTLANPKTGPEATQSGKAASGVTEPATPGGTTAGGGNMGSGGEGGGVGSGAPAGSGSGR